MPPVLPLALLASLGLVACGSSHVPPPSSSTTPASGRADIGGYELAYGCVGAGEPTVILEAGLGAAGTGEFIGFINRVAGTTPAARSRPRSVVGADTCVHREAPEVVLAAIEQVVEAARSGSALIPCDQVFGSMAATCVAPGTVPELVPA